MTKVFVLAWFIILTMTTAVTPVKAQADEEENDWLRFLSVGDSFASGEGLPNIQLHEEDCQRALGLQAEGGVTPSKAWPVLVKEHFENRETSRWKVAPFWFTACTGNTSDQFARSNTKKGTPQLGEAVADSGDEPWDVITASFGGNDVDFAGVLRDCIGLDSDLGDPEVMLPANSFLAVSKGFYAGCSKSEDDMKRLIDEKLPFKLETLYDEIAGVASGNGLVVITGYPQLVRDPSQWNLYQKTVNRCHRLSEGDARSLRAATVYMNEKIGEQVRNAGSRHPDLTWLYVDVVPTFEPSADDSHALCGKEEWINGLSAGGITDGDWRGFDGGAWEVSSTFSRSYHPNQDGHYGYSRAVISAIEASGWQPSDVAGGDTDQTDDDPDSTAVSESVGGGGSCELVPLTSFEDAAIVPPGVVFCDDDWAVVGAPISAKDMEYVAYRHEAGSWVEVGSEYWTLDWTAPEDEYLAFGQEMVRVKESFSLMGVPDYVFTQLFKDNFGSAFTCSDLEGDMETVWSTMATEDEWVEYDNALEEHGRFGQVDDNGEKLLPSIVDRGRVSERIPYVVQQLVVTCGSGWAREVIEAGFVDKPYKALDEALRNIDE